LHPARYVPKLRYELIGCSLHGHELVGTDAATLRPQDAILAREDRGFRWYRCLRCDSWLALPLPSSPTVDTPPDRTQIDVPLRGRALRDRYVLRVIATERAIHVLVLATITVAILLFAAHRNSLHHEFAKVLTDLQGALGGPVNYTKHGVLSDINRVFDLSEAELYGAGVVAAAYTAVQAAEMVGLWFARRWAEYLTFIECLILIPFEVYELSSGVSALKILTLVINVAVVVYLGLVHRLFGLRGGRAAEERLRRETGGWYAVEQATLPELEGVAGSVGPGG
jgi:uncharacterized membrane protein (DUF2068 family)